MGRRSKVVSTLGCISPSLKTVIPTTTKTELSFFLFHGLSRSDKLSVSFSASRHCSLLYSKFPTTTFSITYMIKKKLKFRVLFPPKKNYPFGLKKKKKKKKKS